ncbi:hypothetical protein ACFP81_14325 [Deinococcus lacus]|uniref:ATPase dynein-related AAA domain-containing protein n=1 Tax=Deinococcus lacus TaxID=392561 RepID=A0ABW1YFF0_9DEIO
MEYVAHQLGLVFMKINGPSLGHAVRSLDPAQAPDATSRQELEKLTLALEMGNNVMLYVDDIQHTSPEFLQKFISLTDGTRRIEGVWEGKTRTYDLRGKKFAVVMAGNPYTESGEVFKVPDMLANRADIYNLGDVLGGREDDFLLSYLENALTSNPVLAPLATRDMGDLYTLIDRALGKDVSTATLSHSYSAAELNEIVAVLERLTKLRTVLARVNAQYIASAAQAEAYRTEPPFKLQGSYRNMNKLAEKVSPVMNDAELEGLLTDHYTGEAQMLTGGAEENLLKLAELRGTLTPEQAERWEKIKADFRRSKAMGGDDADTGGRMVAQLADIASGLQALGQVAPARAAAAPTLTPEPLAEALAQSLGPVLAQIAAGCRGGPLAQRRRRCGPLSRHCWRASRRRVSARTSLMQLCKTWWAYCTASNRQGLPPQATAVSGQTPLPQRDTLSLTLGRTLKAETGPIPLTAKQQQRASRQQSCRWDWLLEAPAI